MRKRKDDNMHLGEVRRNHVQLAPLNAELGLRGRSFEKMYFLKRRKTINNNKKNKSLSTLIMYISLPTSPFLQTKSPGEKTCRGKYWMKEIPPPA